MKNQIYINKTNETNPNEKSLVDVIKKLEVVEQQIKVFENHREELINQIINHGYDTIGIESLNKRVTVVVKAPTKTINYNETLKDVNQKDYETIKVTEKVVFDDKKIINELGAKVVYETKQSKPFLKIGDLVKEQGE